MFHVHDTGHQVKNSQVSLERGKYFDGQNAYDATDLSLIMSTGSHEVAVGVAYGTLAQLEKDSDEHALQRIIAQVTESWAEVDSMIKTNIPELRRPWFVENHSDVLSPWFIVISRLRVVYCIDENKECIAFYRQTP